MAKRVGVDKWIFFTTLLLVVVGLVMVFSASAVVAQERYHSAFADRRQAGRLGAGRRAAHGLPHARRLHPLQLAALHLSRSLRHHPAAGAGLLLARLAQHPSLDSLWRALHLSAV